MSARLPDPIAMNVILTTWRSGAKLRADWGGILAAWLINPRGFAPSASVPVQGESSDSPLFTPHQVAAIAFLFSAVLTILGVLCLVLWLRS